MSGVASVVDAVRSAAPLVHCITATVSMNLVADALLAAGARPMMTETEAEAPVVDAVADVLLINLGTLSADGAAGIPPTVAAARDRGAPWVLDPAAIGRGPVRTPLAHKLAGRGPAVIRGNASEILVLARAGEGGRGADSTARPEDAAAAAASLARASGSVVAVSGPVDVITDGDRVRRIASGSPLLTRVTGTGCALGGLTAACCAVADPFEAAVAATAWLTGASERAAAASRGPGSFRVGLLDELFLVTPAEVEGGVRWG